MPDQFTRNEMMFGKEAVQKLANSRVAVFGLGGVGGMAAEALARSGIGALDLIDGDKVAISNINRQIFATLQTVGMYKVEAAIERIALINPNCKTTGYKIFYLPGSYFFDFSQYDYVLDAIDTVAGKLEIIKNAKAANVPVISAMGAGNKLNAAALEVADIFSTSVCPLAKTMRRELKKLGVSSLKTVYSKEPPITPIAGEESSAGRKKTPASNSFVPPAAGLIMAGEVVKDLIFGITKK